MYKTIWIITTDYTKTVRLTYYHFGKTPKFPTDYMEENHFYDIELIWHFKLTVNVKTFFKCLFHDIIITNR